MLSVVPTGGPRNLIVWLSACLAHHPRPVVFLGILNQSKQVWLLSSASIRLRCLQILQTTFVARSPSIQNDLRNFLLLGCFSNSNPSQSSPFLQTSPDTFVVSIIPHFDAEQSLAKHLPLGSSEERASQLYQLFRSDTKLEAPDELDMKSFLVSTHGSLSVGAIFTPTKASFP